MQLLDQHRLGHIIEYCHRVQTTIERFGNSYEAFSADGDYQQSIAFSILQIGELVAGLSEEYKESTNGKCRGKLSKQCEISWRMVMGI